jgi:GNAT superfamily N-acetyltransferase
VKRPLEGGFELDTDPARVDLDAVARFLAEESYWAKGRPRETVERLLHEAQYVVGIYKDGRQAAFCRVASDGVAFAFLADVFVLPEFRGQGLGVELVREAVENGPYPNVRWLLGTDDAHTLYEKFGFRAPSRRIMERPS